MPPTMQDVRRWLDPEEVDYAGAKAALGPGAFPHLLALVQGPDAALAAKAAYLAGLISGEGSEPVVRAAAQSSTPAVRVAAASTARYLPERGATALLDLLERDSDVGVRKVLVKSASVLRTPTILNRVRGIVERDPDEVIRRLRGHVERP
ncbi:MAG TPA: HEAT repeat domain-containing protein [Gemmatimonadaceae bacterium]|nr:HEAT repeat domain-containing protein [Gemmatimonadaceae bacterium]